MPQVPLVMFTNMAVSTLEQEARDAGISAVVSKSESTDTLILQAKALLL
jgi:CheY-like chemotaxis protein